MIAFMQRLVGTWRGEGRGSYPDLPPFQFVEETTFVMAADWTMLHVLQQTWQHAGDRVRQKGLHLEAGLLMARPDGELLYNCGQDSGRVEVMTGTPEVTPDGRFHIAWRTTAHAHDPRLVAAGRDWWIGDTTLEYTAKLSTVRTPEYRQHLEAQLTRFQ